MSAKLTGMVWELDLPHKQQSVLLALADNAHDDGTHCYPGVDYLVWKTGIERRTLQRILRALEAKGLIIPVTNTEGGRGRELEYRIDISKGEKKRAWREVRAEIREKKRASISRPLSDVKDDNTPPIDETVKDDNMPLFSDSKGRQNESERVTDSDLKGVKTNTAPSITEPNTETTTNHTHTPARAPTAVDGNGSMGGGVKGSKFSPEFLRTYALKHNLGAGWLNNAVRGLYDQGIDLQLERDALDEQATARDTRGQPVRDTSLCPDCKGSGFKPSVSGQSGVAKCTHPHLDEAIKRAEQEVEAAKVQLRRESTAVT